MPAEMVGGWEYITVVSLCLPQDYHRSFLPDIGFAGRIFHNAEFDESPLEYTLKSHVALFDT